MNIIEFKRFMNKVAEGWNKQDTRKATDCFTEDVLYTQPPGLQFYKGKRELTDFFNQLTPSTKMTWHNLAVNGNIGFGEYTFKMDKQNHGVVVVELQNGKIKNWREYQWSGDLSFEEFLNKQIPDKPAYRQDRPE